MSVCRHQARSQRQFACYSLIMAARANDLKPSAYIYQILKHIGEADTQGTGGVTAREQRPEADPEKELIKSIWAIGSIRGR